ncbi:MAG: hypothetical protein AB7O67_17205 [Vicinamibacterales bacterium]
MSETRVYAFRLHALRLVGACLAAVATSLLAPVQARGLQDPDEALWTGTITVVRQAAGEVAAGAEAGIGVTASERVSWSLNGDGSAQFTATYEERQIWTNNGMALPIVITASGGGVGLAGASRLDPDPLAERLLGVRAGWVVFAQAGDAVPGTEDRSEFERPIFNMFAELGAALSGQPKPAYNPADYVLPTEHGPGGVEVPAGGPATVATLSGSYTQPTALGQFQVAGTETVTWSLTRVTPPSTPRVTIRGPECGCLDPDRPEGTSFRFSAFAAPGGGEFSSFTVTAEGAAPEILVNDGGEQPALELLATRDTGAVTLDITYERDGRTIKAPSRRVEFCLVEPVEIVGGTHDYAFDGRGMLTVQARGRAWHNGQDVSGQLRWEAEAMGRPTRLETTPFDGVGQDITFRYQGLPEANADFGQKRITARSREGRCACERETRVRAFFDPEARTHPGQEDVPNWFHYWRQTPAAAAVRPVLHYVPVVRDRDGRIVLALYEGETGRIFVGDLIPTPLGCRPAVSAPGAPPVSRERATGLDCFAETLRHEVQHRDDAIEWWGDAAGPASAGMTVMWQDFDSDQVPNRVESQLPGCSVTSQMSCDARPFDDVTDAEIRAYYTGWTWPLGSLNREDWSCGPLAKQWSGGSCR